MNRIGVRELRQNASRYLARVEGGESLEITARGRPVAMLVPIHSNPWETLVASGTVMVPAEHGDVLDEGTVDYGVDASRRLAELRAGER
jgi:prevent-host-death family protein